MRPTPLEPRIISEWLETHPKWRLDDGHLARDMATIDYPTSALVVQAQVSLAERLDHHPLITVGYRTVGVEIWTHDQGGITSLDLEYCEGFDEIVKELLAGSVS